MSDILYAMGVLPSVSKPGGLSTGRAGEQSRIAYIHAGTHKTGTTYLQLFLTCNESILSQAGLYIPRAGRLGLRQGHHHLAWELYGDHRYTLGRSTLAELVDELQSLGSPTFCISSEDFEFLHRYPDALRRLQAALGSLGYTCRPIFYLRPQVDYGESLYRELVKHGLAIDFDEFFRAFSAGEFTLYEKWHFSANYQRLLDGYARVFGKSNMIVRRYRRGAPDDIVMDFVSQVLTGWSMPPGSFQHPVNPANTAVSPSEMFPLFIRNRQGAIKSQQSSPDQPKIPELPERFEPLSVSHIGRACRHLAWANGKVLSRYGVFIPVVSRRRLAKCALASAGIGRYARWQKLSKRMFTIDPLNYAASGDPATTDSQSEP